MGGIIEESVVWSANGGDEKQSPKNAANVCWASEWKGLRMKDLTGQKKWGKEEMMRRRGMKGRMKHRGQAEGSFTYVAPYSV